MDPNISQSQLPADDWDAEGFEIPKLKLNASKSLQKDHSGSGSGHSDSKVSTANDNIYLGPHGAPPSRKNQQEVIAAAKTQHSKSKGKEDVKKKSPYGTRMR